jgi:hypothetical protein
MEKIIEYQTITTFECADLDKLVNEAIQTGFQPYGPPYGSDGAIAQAMVKFETPGANGEPLISPRSVRELRW